MACPAAPQPASSSNSGVAAQRPRSPPGFPVPDDFLLDVFGHLGFGDRRAICLVCRRWSRLADHPTLLEALDVTCTGEDWEQRFLDFAAWLPPRAAHVRQLSVCAASSPALPPPSPSALEEQCAAEAMGGMLAACATAGQLTELRLELGHEFQQSRWLPALRSLRCLVISTPREVAVDAPLASLTALEELQLGGLPTHLPTHLPDSTHLPSSLTKLRLSYLQEDLLPEQLRRLTRLHSLYLTAMPHLSSAYSSLVAVSHSLRSLSIHGCRALPDCLPQLGGLEALSVHDRGGLKDHSGGQPAAILAAALPHLTGLTRLALVSEAGEAGDDGDAPPQPPSQAEQQPGPAQLITATLPLLADRSRLHSLLLAASIPAGVSLPAGLHGLRQLAGPAQLLADSLPALAPVTGLQLLALLSCDGTLTAAELGSFLDLLEWAVRLPQLDKFLMEASDDQIENARDALFGVYSLCVQHAPAPPANFEFSLVPDAFHVSEIHAMADLE